MTDQLYSQLMEYIKIRIASGKYKEVQENHLRELASEGLVNPNTMQRSLKS